MFRKYSSAVVILSSFLLWGAAAVGQSTNNGSQQSLPPLSPLGPEKTVGGGVVPGDSGEVVNQQLIPDTRTLAGGQELTLGSSPFPNNFILPSFSIVTQVGTNPFTTGPNSTTHPDTLSTSLVSGRLAVNHISESSEFLLDYLAGANVSNDSTQGDSLIQALQGSETVRFGRWSVLFADQFSYLSNSPFGYGGLGGLGNLGVGLGNGVGTSPGISPNLAPTQSIYINGLPRINNTGLGQTTYAMSHRSSLTLLGSYSTLNFRNSPLENSSVASFQVGYDYLLSRQNSLSVFYRFEDFGFPNQAQGFHVHSFVAAFARRITGHLSWTVGGGPSLQLYRQPLTGSGTIAIPMAFTGLRYWLRHTALSLDYRHGLTNGSGILPGAETDTISGEVARSVSRRWDFSIQSGYSRNRVLGQTLLSKVGLSPQTWFATAEIRRRFVAYGAFFLAFNAAGQTDLSSICPLSVCRINSLTSTGSIGYTWGLRPIPLE